ncbi:hypothetical protein PQR53_01620 [Paraburkholderia fungorum]|uniref:hypothetical protein n=1 Tax=Paraburkholderia fungorum TaxID=134537 RepID=UPI0038B7EDC4
MRQIAEHGHVMGTKPSLGQLVKNNGMLILTSVGISQASTFTGFCAYHDKHLFAPLEDEPITLSDEQLFLLAYRSLARELYAKEGNAKTAELMREVDRGRDKADQIAIQTAATGYATGVDLALNELHQAKDIMDGMLASGDFAAMNHFIVELSQLPSVLVSASTQPEFDFSGNRLQTFGSSTDPMSHIIFNCISYDAVGCFVFSWLQIHDEVCAKFIETLVGLGKHEIGNALVRFAYSFAENTWASPKWWNLLNKQARDDVSLRLQHGMLIPHSPACLLQNGVDFGAFHVDKVSYRRAGISSPV